MEPRPLAVDSKRKAPEYDVADDSWKLSKCQKPSPEKFMVRLEISSPDSFSVKPFPVDGYKFPGEAACFEKLSVCLPNVVPSHFTQNHVGGEACVYNLKDYDAVVKALKIERVDYEDIPYVTRRAISILSRSYVEGRWEPCRPEHLSDAKVDELMGQLPKSLLEVLLPFQIEGVKFGLRRGGRCLIADEMGLGKTLQAIAIASCFMNEGPILVVCPAILRYTWAEELEHWLPSCLPSDIHLVFGHVNNPANLARPPKVVVISYTMLNHLKKSILKQKWALLIVDESHHVRCTKRKSSEAGETQAVLDVASKIDRIVLLSGTPSLSRPYDIFHQINILWPGLLGKDKLAFAKTYCSMSTVRTYQGIVYQDFSKGIRLEELNVLLKQTVMIRRLKDHVLMQLPPIRRQIINLVIKKSDIDFAKEVCSMANDDASTENEVEDALSDDPNKRDGENDDDDCCNSSRPSNQVIGIAKLAGFKEWLLMHPIIAESDDDEKFDSSQSSHKMIIFVHYHKVTDRLQEFLCEKGVKFVRIDGRDASARDRQQAISSFQHSKEVKIALVGILAGSSGLDLSAAQNVVFLELPEKISDFQQAESRAHRRGQTNAVNVYIFCAKDTSDEYHWKRLNTSLHRTSSTVDGKYDSLMEIMVEDVSLLKTVEEKHNEANLIFEGESDSESSANEPVICSQYASGEEMQPEVFSETATSKSDGEAFGPFLKYCYKKTANIVRDVNNEGNVASNVIPEVYNHETKKDNIVISHTLLDVDADKLNAIEILCDREPIDQAETEAADPDCVPANSLRFEVSKYTGRIHLYSCIHGVETRPTPLFKNFRPDELETKKPSVDDKKCIKDDSIYIPALLSFVEEWNSLRPIEQSKLYNKPLQLPLAVELCLNESQNHDKDGLLKGGSKKRGTSLDDISQPLPPNAVWKNVSIFHGKKERQYLQGCTLTGQPLCKLCQKNCTKKSAREPEFFEDLFCDLECYEEYRLRTSNRYLRTGLAQIEHGVCTNCHLDCRKLVKNIKPLSLEKRREFVIKEAPKLAARKNLLEKLINDPTEGNAWHADHIVPVYRGGGECRLENMRTLCIACHAEVTAAQCAERRSERAKAKKQLNRLLANLKTVQDKQKDCDDCGMIDSELLVNVPGSAYHTTNINGGRSDKASEDVSS
ncbi:putative DNA helicase chromatin remodeling SNF2 family [Helianthus annuus]|uniref:DNA helicase chromatin remodeling SNF2 family n=1 Tax=Helianthus annuus TaxID=4232 RepID=A0A251SE07_HELAN|nr:DNA annealing helicase and endonuclease ZRANB3 isoform X2 [Helianthus annuus]KAF5796880.1 putative DNA helicase chromatin remodeling SNF2 family [Helianthus annuus]KAJ0540138.1 putative DNA helicase chromatin remodeling SNF2 family [Helianthus annuus]KAJ0548563.1 putative DNA helicase chromatin remodeling SNF2 family [Helianthus annuus]KAJ0554882.1 putative DNA helicase chromatin remodeling SNF2 family [Helianthus annuus]KAJ0720445.1 putative DNA helicase chromatin remodeling SNF2 family [H